MTGAEPYLDCIIFATGFEVGGAWTRRAGYDLVGIGGKSLSAQAAWAPAPTRPASTRSMH